MRVARASGVALFLACATATTVHAQFKEYIPEPKDPASVVRVTGERPKRTVGVRGNVMIEASRLQSIGGWSDTAQVSDDQMAMIVDKLKGFYRSEGFTLVELSAERQGEIWLIRINEGLLGGINVYGAGWWDTYVLRTALLPYDIFNETRLREALDGWLASNPGLSIRFETEPLESKRDSYWKVLDKNGAFSIDLTTLLKLQRYAGHQLHIYVDRKSETKKLTFGINYSSSFGINLDGGFAKDSMFTKNDRLYGRLRVGIDRRDSIDPAKAGDTIFYSNSALDLRWYTPPLGSDWFRLFAEAGILNRIDQRPDLPIDKYRMLVEHVSANANFEFLPYKSAYVKLGQELQHVFNVDLVPSDPYTIADDSVNGLIAGVGVDMLFGKPRRNYMLNDIFRARYEFAFREGSQTVRRTEAWYQKVWRPRHGDYILFSKGMWTAGQAQFFDERPITHLGIRNSFDTRVYVRAGVDVSGEVRFNLWGDDIQVGIFSDVVFFGGIDRATLNQSMEAALAAGPAMYFSFFDAFQFSLNYASGFITQGDRSYEINLGFDKVF